MTETGAPRPAARRVFVEWDCEEHTFCAGYDTAAEAEAHAIELALDPYVSRIALIP